jgi:LPXTG-motif cell wall-anchored protein
VISGTPTATGTFNFTVKATNGAGSATKSLSIVIVAAGHIHTPGADWQHDATDHWKACDDCADKLNLAAHTVGDWIVDKAATATTDGSKHKECTVCEYVTATEKIPATGSGHTHNYGSEWKKDATGHWHECTCGVRSGLAAHTSGAWIVDKAATATTDGSRHKECTVCGHTETGIIPATGNQKDNDPDDSQTGGDNTILWVLLGGAALVIIGGAFFFGRKWRGGVK